MSANLFEQNREKTPENKKPKRGRKTVSFSNMIDSKMRGKLTTAKSFKRKKMQKIFRRFWILLINNRENFFKKS